MLAIEAITLAHPSFFGQSANGVSTKPSMSADGQLVVFESTADDLVPNDHNGASDVFLYDRGTGDVSLVSTNFEGTASGSSANSAFRDSHSARISSDGRYVVFVSAAADLVEGFVAAAGSTSNIYLRDLQTRTTTLVSQSRDVALQAANGPSTEPRISADGSTVLFASFARDLVDGLEGGNHHLYAWDRASATNELITINQTNTAPANAPVFSPGRNLSLSSTGRFVAFRSVATDLVDIDNNGIDQIYLRDRVEQKTTLVTVDHLGGIGGNGHSFVSHQAISDDGRFVVFYGGDQNLVDAARSSAETAYVRDMQTGVTSYVSVHADGIQGRHGFSPVITPDGSRVAFTSLSDDLVAEDSNGRSDVFVRDLTSNETILVSANAEGTGSGAEPGIFFAHSIPPTITANGRFVAFHSTAIDLVANVSDTPSTIDVFVRDLVTNTTSAASRSNVGQQLGNDESYTAADRNTHLGLGLSEDGTYISFESLASNLSVDDKNQVYDVYTRDLRSDVTELVSRLDTELPPSRLGNSGGALRSTSQSGRWVAYTANQNDIRIGSDITPDEPIPFPQLSVYVHDRETGETVLGSKGADDLPVCYHGTNPVLTANGRFLAFASICALDENFPDVPGPQPSDVFVRDLWLGVTEQISLNPDRSANSNGVSGSAIDGNSGSLQISPDGRFVAFLSTSTDLVENVDVTSRSAGNIYVHDRETGITHLVNLSVDGSQSVDMIFPQILGFSRNSSRLLFTLQVIDGQLVAGSDDTNGRPDVYVYDLTGDAAFRPRLVSANTDGDAANGISGTNALPATISHNGRFVAFGSDAADIVPGAEANALGQIYVRDLELNSTELVSFNVTGDQEANSASSNALITGDGRRVIFESTFTTNLTDFGGNARSQLYVRDLDSNLTTLITRNALGTALADAASGNLENTLQAKPAVSPNGRYLVFESRATDLVEGYQPIEQPFNTTRALYLHDFETGNTTIVDHTHTGTFSTGEGARVTPWRTSTVVTDQAEIFFGSSSEELLPRDRNQFSDIFVYTHEGNAGIRGTVFDDEDENGAKNDAETGLQDWTVYVDENQNHRYDVGERNVQTDSQGDFLFANLPEGEYAIRARPQAGYGFTTVDQLDVRLEPQTTEIGLQFGVSRPNVDLVVSAVSSPQLGSPGASVNVSFTVTNVGDGVSGSWADAVYLSQTPTISPDATLLTTISREGGLAEGSRYRIDASVVLPSVPEGTYYLVAETDRRFQVRDDTARLNNYASAGHGIAISIPTLDLNVPLPATFTRPGQEIYYKIDVAAGEVLQIELDSASTSGGVELYARFGRLPTASRFDSAARRFGQPDQQLTIAPTRPGTYYVLARSRFGDAARDGFTITASIAELELHSISPAVGSNSGVTTVQLDGTGFKDSSTIDLLQGDTVVQAASVVLENASTLFATFDLTGRPLGTYTVRVSDSEDSASLVGAFEVTDEVRLDALQVYFTAPEAIRFGRPATVLVEYENTGTTDIVAPLLRLKATNATLKLPAQSSYQGDSLTFYGYSQAGPAGILRPGERSHIEIDFLSNGVFGEMIDFQVYTVEDDEQLDWAAFKKSLQPNYISDEAWDVVFENLTSTMGTTARGYEAVLSANANYLSQFGILTADTGRLLSLSMADANSTLAADFLATVEDAAVPSPGLDLTFVRQHQQSLAGRFSMGAFGRGWTANWNISLVELEDTVVVEFGAHRRYFRKNDDASFSVVAGAASTLTRNDGSYQLQELDGTVTRFDSRGRLHDRLAPNGQRIVAETNEDGMLRRLTHSNGSFIEFVYGDHGFVERLFDSSGGEVTYEYEADHLVAYVDRFGRHTYTYVDDARLATQHALESINYSDDTHLNFRYDDQGRLVEEHRDGGQHRVVFTYPGHGQIVRTDQNELSTHRFYDDRANLVRDIDAKGKSVTYTYDDARNLIRVDAGSGVHFENIYDDQGNMITTVDPYGNQSNFEYDARGNLIRFQDSLGRATRFTYDDANQVKQTIYADGSGTTRSYDADGMLESLTDADGATTLFETNQQGAITSKRLPDGSQVTYEYDPLGRLTRATDSSGAITFEYAPTHTLEKVTYPDGTFLDFESNEVGQRTQVTDNTGFMVTYEYDDLGRISRLADKNDQLLEHYEYDAAGRVLRKDRGNGTYTMFDYDELGSPLTISHFQPDGDLNSRFEYTYDHAGRRTSMTLFDVDPATVDGVANYAYDAIGQLIEAVLPDGQSYAYEYDSLGNRTRVTHNNSVTSYRTDRLNGYTSVGSTRVAYDAKGSVETVANTEGTTRFEYDSENRLTAVKGPDGDIHYTYNALGLRQSRTSGGETVHFLLDPSSINGIHAQYDQNGAFTHFVRGKELVGQVDALGDVAYYDFDGNSNVIGLTNATGEYVNRYTYMPFGQVQSSLESIDNHFTFAGAVGAMSDASGLVHMGFRNYDPLTGRFLELDPAGLVAGDANLRRYVTNDPINQVDPTGLDPDPPEQDDCSIYQGIFYWTCKWWNWPPKDPWTPIPSVGDPGNAGGGAGDGGGAGPYCDNDPPFGSPPAGSGFGPSGSTNPVAGFDPNDIVGPAGVGSQHHILPNQMLNYTVRFENLPDASAPAQEVYVTHPLDEDLDLATFELDRVGFADVSISVPSGLQSYRTMIDSQNLDGSPLRVDISAELDIESRTVLWTFLSVDPFTGSYPPGVFDGFLPPNIEAPIGEGFVSYSIRPLLNLPSGTRVEPEASIVFDFNEPIVTPPIFNTIDAGTPTSQVATLPASVPAGVVEIRWNGQDEAGGSGIGYYDIFVSIDGGPFELLVERTETESVEIVTEAHHQYAFYSIAVDLVGHRESVPQQPDTIIDVVLPGDLNGDAIVSVSDVDLMCGAILDNIQSATFDLNLDGVVSRQDHDYLIKMILNANYGDADLNGLFNSSDLVQVFRFGTYEDGVPQNSGWGQGDWDCDGEFTTSDLVVAFADGGYTASATAEHTDRQDTDRQPSLKRNDDQQEIQKPGISIISASVAASILQTSDHNSLRNIQRQEAQRPNAQGPPALRSFPDLPYREPLKVHRIIDRLFEKIDLISDAEELLDEICVERVSDDALQSRNSTDIRV